MRTVAYTLHHSLTAEAASTVKQALTLARRRGHAQVTPLHVATAMLSSPTCLLRKACLHANSHPLQCKALELCFNVALNRLPTSASSPVLAPHHPHNPSMSNSLVAAFKRAQAHQRRGSVENQRQQQQQVLALKVEIEQLIISILDDPSVSRVMREAGFSSTRVKQNVEQLVGANIRAQSSLMSSDQARASDVMGVVETMMGKKRKNTVVVGECLGTAESVIRGVIDKFERRNEIPEELKSVEFVSLPLFSLRNLSRGEVEEKIMELRCLVKRSVVKGVVLYLGDLKWVSEFWSNYDQKRNIISYYSPVEHMIMEVSRILCGIGESGKLWVMGVATLNTYMRCKIGHPSLETLWELYPLTIPIGSLGLGLKLESDSKDQLNSSIVSRDGLHWFNKTGVEKQLTCCADCSKNFTREAQRISSNIHENESTITSSISSLPSWLQQYKEQNRKQTFDIQEYEKVTSLCKKWNSICSSIHKQPHFVHNTIHFSPSSPSVSLSSKLQQRFVNWPVIFEPNVSPKEHQFFVSESYGDGLESKLKTMKPDLLSNPNSSPNSASSSEVSEGDMECLNRFKELNTENVIVLYNALEKKVPWQRGIVPEIVGTTLRCRAGLMRRKGDLEHKEKKEETWLFFLGADSQGKEKIARELAKHVFGSKGRFISIGLSSFSSTRADSTDQEFSNKRSRNETGQSYLERFASEVGANPRRVFFMEDVEQVDYFSQLGIMKAIESGRISLPSGEFVPLKDAIVIFSCESFSSASRACSPPIRQKYGEKEERDSDKIGDNLEEKKSGPRISLDLNMATEVDNGDESSVSNIGILDSVDKQVVFKIQML